MEIEYVGCLHRGFYRFNVSDTGIKDFVDGYVDIEVSKNSDRINIHGLQHGGTPRVVTELTKLFNENKKLVREKMDR